MNPLQETTVFSLLLVVFAFTGITGMMYVVLDSDTSSGSMTGAAITSVASEKISIGSSRLFITPRTRASGEIIRNMLGVDVLHEFGATFSAIVQDSFRGALLPLADIEDVPLYAIQSFSNSGQIVKSGQNGYRHRCGNLICEQDEDISCPLDCGTALFERTCTPNFQPGINFVGNHDIRRGLGRRIAILDTGLRSHSDLQTPAVCVDTTGHGIVSSCLDNNGHGTALAGIVAGSGGPDHKGLYGVVPAATLFVVKVCSDEGRCYADDVLEGLQYVSSENLQVVLFGFGGRVNPGAVSSNLFNAKLNNHNTVFVAPVGNDPFDGVLFPAIDPSVIGVGSINSDGVVSDFSAVSSDPRKGVLLVAPGEEIVSTDNKGCYSSISGTSASAALVAGLAAIVYDDADGISDKKGSARAVRTYLTNHARDVLNARDGNAGPGVDRASGYGVPEVP